MHGSRTMKMPFLPQAGIILLAALLLAGPARLPAATQDPSGVVRTLHDSLLDAMKGGKQLGYRGRRDALAPVISDTFAIAGTARIAAGRHWSGFTPVQRREYLRAYTEWTIATFAGRFDGYSGERFEEISEKVTPKGATVVSALVKPDGERIDFHYRLALEKGRWRIVDIRISGVSQLALTRSQFTAILRKKGFKGLIARLEEKIAEASGKKAESEERKP